MTPANLSQARSLPGLVRNRRTKPKEKRSGVRPAYLLLNSEVPPAAVAGRHPAINSRSRTMKPFGTLCLALLVGTVVTVRGGEKTSRPLDRDFIIKAAGINHEE